MDTWEEDVAKQINKLPPEAVERRNVCLNDLWAFAQTVNPGYMYGDIHKKLYRWLQDYSLYGKSYGDSTSANKLVLLPRAHLKSHVLATTVAWLITRHPEITIMYVSATAELAESQLFAIKATLESRIYQFLFPEYVKPQEAQREMWNSRKIMVDHVARRKEGVRDPTIATAGLTTNTTGWHADVIIADDLVVPENAYTEDGRESVAKKASQFTSIRNAGGFTLAAGTRYHPADIYDTWKSQMYDVYENDELVDKRPVWDVVQHAVEIDNHFLWPRAVGESGKAFGFDVNALARIKAEYIDSVQFYAQYYNDPNDPGSDRIRKDRFQYIDQRMVRYENGSWYARGKRLNIYAAVDFAFSLKKKADFTAIVVVGIDCDGFFYVLDIDRFKTDKLSELFKHTIDLHSKWGFRKLRAECTAAQVMIANDLKDRIREEGMNLVIDEYRPTRHEGSKEERISSILEPRYENLSVFHIKGGYTPALEEELIQARPKHDDLKDALASAISIAVKPGRSSSAKRDNKIVYGKFGGVAFRRT